ncbi:NAD(P)/FAD-dependent oxidoreductase [Halomonas llamarensis]|uniref:FAD-dependent oxidoreductase n=1 Tax=Halomonas llamarensis TaxID=2945104 RepID=A0ABT0SS87_9GAMM|nr:FAD-dependent oxidoreductase [Halomonas llamarensis]MCL7930699.1 FAD-dependent oxidoreductase [Halomonas llamarensis]
MSIPHADLVIIGTGMAGVGLARALRREGDTRRLTLISADSGDDYSKPLLSTGFAKQLAPDKLAQRDASALAEALNATLLPHTPVTAIDPEARQLTLDDGSAYAYTQLVLATGAAPRAPFAIPSECEAHCFSVNDLDDYRRFHRALGQGPARVAIVGAGLVGCEFANDLHAGGHHVSLIAPESAPLPRLLPEPLGRALGDAFADAGMQLALGRTLERIASGASLNVALTLDNHETIEADLVLLSTGLAPRTALAATAGLEVSASGITVDRTLQTSHPGIFALGDAACVAGVNAMYVQPLQASANALSKTLAGTPTPVHFGAWPVIVKTPLLPVVAYPPLVTPERWRIEADGANMTALAEDIDGRLIGFALTGGCVRRKVELSRAAPALLG